MDEDIAFVDKEIQRLEEIAKNTYYRLAKYRSLKKRLIGPDQARIQLYVKPVQLNLFGT